MRTIVLTGSASGMGAATKARLEAGGDRVIGVDIAPADVVADLGTVEGRRLALERVGELSGGVIDGLVTWAGIAGLTETPGSELVSVNYFGHSSDTRGLRPMLSSGSAAVAISSNSVTCQPGVPMDVVEHCLAGDEESARKAADSAGGIGTYPASKTAVAKWVRRNAPGQAWAGQGITSTPSFPEQ